MSKCKPTVTRAMLDLEASGVSVSDIRERVPSTGEEQRYVVIRIPYTALRDNKDVQTTFQDLVYIATESESGE